MRCSSASPEDGLAFDEFNGLSEQISGGQFSVEELQLIYGALADGKRDALVFFWRCFCPFLEGSVQIRSGSMIVSTSEQRADTLNLKRVFSVMEGYS
jgi:hypothetical protein